MNRYSAQGQLFVHTVFPNAKVVYCLSYPIIFPLIANTATRYTWTCRHKPSQQNTSTSWCFSNVTAFLTSAFERKHSISRFVQNLGHVSRFHQSQEEVLALRIITFSNYYAHTHYLFKENRMVKLLDLIFLHNALLLYDYYTCKLPLPFQNSLLKTKYMIVYTRLASKRNFYLPAARTNYGKFSIQFQGIQVWNSINEK